MTCQHPNPAGYIFCNACGQALNHQRCRCGFVCTAEALYCGRCGHSLAMDNELTAVSTVEHRYDLDCLVKLAGMSTDKKAKIVEWKGLV